MSKQAFPEALQTKPMELVSTMRIETSVLEPIVISQTFARFVLEKKGILDLNSVITMSVHPTGAGSDKVAFLPIKTGAICAISRAVLRVADKVVATSDQLPHYQTIKRQMKSVEEKSQKDMVRLGCIGDAICPSTAQNGKLQLRDLDFDAGNLAGHPLQPFLLTTSTTDCPIFSIRLSELFPFMVGMQLPLFAINDSATIELTFTQQTNDVYDVGKLCSFVQGLGADREATIGTNNVRLLADYLFYDDARMKAISDGIYSKDGFAMPYDDIVTTITSFPQAGGAGPQTVVRDIGVSGMMCKNILVSEGSVNDNIWVFGPYCSKAFLQADAYNVRVNDVQKYPRDIVSETRKFVELGIALGGELQISGAEYSLDRGVDKTSYTLTEDPFDSTVLLQANPMTLLTGAQHYLGVDLRTNPYSSVATGVRVGAKPIQFIHTINRRADVEARPVRYFTTVERVLLIKNGQVTVSA